MDAHINDSKEILMSRWDHNGWNDFSGSGKLKLETVYEMSTPTEQINKAINFVDVNCDKGRVVKECYKCEQCQETMSNKQMLKQHKDSVHNDKKSFRCTVLNCVRAFTSANYLKNHIDIEHTDSSEARLPCPKKDCGLYFPNNYRLKRHIRQDHKQEKLYQCQICARKFASLEVRNNHMKTKHINVPHRDNLTLKLRDPNFYRGDQNKESENETVYAASPISSRFESINGQTSIDTTCEAQWLTKTSDSNPPLSKQIDRILCDIFSDKYQERLHSPLSSSELAIAIVSLEETGDEDNVHQVKMSPHMNPLISGGSSPLKSTYLFSELDKKLCTSYSRLTPNHKNAYNNVSQIFQNKVNNSSMTGQNYPQSNTESEGHSTESQRSFLVNSSQHEEFSDISMESHLKDVFSNAVDKSNVYGKVANSFDNPIKLLDYTCLDTMFDDFHEIITSDTFNTQPFVNGQPPAINNLHNIRGQKNHLLSLNNMHSKFLGVAQFNTLDHQLPRTNAVPSNQITTLSNFELSRRKMNTCFPDNKVQHGLYDLASPFSNDQSARELSSRCHPNGMMNGSMFPQEARIRANFPQSYTYGSNQQVMGNNQMYYNRDPPTLYVQQPERSPYPACMNGSINSTSLYHNSMEKDFINESQTNQYSNVLRRRAPPAYQAGFCHQMLPSQHPTASPLSYCPPSSSSSSMHRNSCFQPQSRGIYADSAAGLPQQQRQQRHLPASQPMAVESQGYRAGVPDVHQTQECLHGILDEDQASSLVTSNEQRSQMNPIQTSAAFSQNCDMTDAKATICM